MSVRERAVAVIGRTASGRYVLDIYGVADGKRRLAVQAHGSLRYVQYISAAYCGQSPAVAAEAAQVPLDTSEGSVSRLKSAVPFEVAEPANDLGEGEGSPRRP